MKNITLVLGTAREGRQSEKVYEYLQSRFAARDELVLTAVDVRDHVHSIATKPNWGPGGADEVPTKWKEIVEGTDAFVFILPEYNHGYPGEWKLLVDTLGEEYKGKHAFVVGVSGGIFAGVRVSDHVKPVLVELNLIPHKAALYVGGIKSAFNEAGEPTDEKFAERAQAFVEEVIISI